MKRLAALLAMLTLAACAQFTRNAADEELIRTQHGGNALAASWIIPAGLRTGPAVRGRSSHSFNGS
jgi:hypothetical protein